MHRLRDLIQSACQSGSIAIVIATNAHREALERSIQASSEDGERPWDQAYRHIDAAGALRECTVGGEPDMIRLRQRLADVMTTADVNSKRPRPFVYGEIVDVLNSQGKFEAAIGVERVWEELAKKWEFSLLCGYGIETFDPPAADSFFVRTCGLHSTVIPPEAYPSPESEKRLLGALAESSKSQSVQ